MARIELNDQVLEDVSGGNITYTWDGTSGTIGIDGDNRFVLLDKAAFVSYYNSVKGTMKDSQILTNLFNQGIIKKP